MKTGFKLGFLFAFAMAFSCAAIADTSCEVMGAARCLCAASMFMNCGQGFRGWVNNSQSAKALTFSVYNSKTGKKQEVTLANPPLGIRDYYAVSADPRYEGPPDKWVINQLAAQGIRVNASTEIDLVSAKFNDDLVLYRKYDKSDPITKRGSSESIYKFMCFYSARPSLLVTDSCSTPVCAGYAKCWVKNTYIGESPVSCRSTGLNCPSASACAADNSVHTATPADVAKDGFEGNLRRRSESSTK